MWIGGTASRLYYMGLWINPSRSCRYCYLPITRKLVVSNLNPYSYGRLWLIFLYIAGCRDGTYSCPVPQRPWRIMIHEIKQTTVSLQVHQITESMSVHIYYSVFTARGIACWHDYATAFCLYEHLSVTVTLVICSRDVLTPALNSICICNVCCFYHFVRF